MRFRDVWGELQPLLASTTLVAHNIAFDLKFMQYECERMDYQYNPPTYCSMQHFTPLCAIPHPNQHNKYKRPKLSEVICFCNLTEDDVVAHTAELFGESGQGAHDARYDTTAVYLAMKNQHH